ncbi:glucuronate isomerase [Candidatus Latescibacterota bacterium]
MAEKLVLHDDRFFDSDSSIRSIARELYAHVKDLPIISPHGHVDPSLFSENRPFPDPAGLIIIPDHYVFRMLYSQGIALESLGIPRIDNQPVETDSRKIWQLFCDNFYLFSGTPTGAWLSHELSTVFGIDEKPGSDTAMRIYDQINGKLQTPEFLPRALFERFNIEVLTTTNTAIDSLDHHKKIKDSGWHGKIVPCLRPDNVVNLTAEHWKKNIEILSSLSGIEVDSYKNFIRALENRREFFISMGATSTDQGVLSPCTHRLTDDEASRIFEKALRNEATEQDAFFFNAHMLMEMARMSIEDGLVMQIHPGSIRNHNKDIFGKFGPDMGCDIPGQTEYTKNMFELLNKYGNNPELTLIVFTLDESTYSRELAPLAGHYPAMKLGPSWWFHDSIDGMTRFREQTTETAGIYNTVGFNDDTRAFPSIPARHDLSRRVDANYLAGLTARHIIDMDDALKMIKALAYDLAKNAYKF